MIENEINQRLFPFSGGGAKIVRFLNRDMVWNDNRHVSRTKETPDVCSTTDRD
jgi:hypothetical protein